MRGRLASLQYAGFVNAAGSDRPIREKRSGTMEFSGKEQSMKKALSNSRRMVLMAGGVFCLTVGSASRAVTFYDITLPSYPPTGQLRYAGSLNDLNQVVGTYQNMIGVPAYIWENGVKTEVPIPQSGDGNFLHDINNAGKCAGGSGYSPIGLLYDGVAFTYLGTLGGSWSTPYAVNENDQVVGFSSTTSSGSHTEPFLWENGSIRSLGSFGGDRGAAYDINNHGMAIGSARNAAGKYRAFVCFEGQAMTDLGTLGGGQAVASAVNDANEVVGWAEVAGGYDRAFFWKDGQMTELPSLGGNRSRAMDINNAGQIIGWAETATGYRPLVIWENGRIIRLDKLIVPDSGWQLHAGGETNFDGKSFFRINNNGVILGRGYINGATESNFLMFPRPEPFLLHDSDNDGIVNLNDFCALSSEWMK